jgi:hypothetical protein
LLSITHRGAGRSEICSHFGVVEGSFWGGPPPPAPTRAEDRGRRLYLGVLDSKALASSCASFCRCFAICLSCNGPCLVCSV